MKSPNRREIVGDSNGFHPAILRARAACAAAPPRPPPRAAYPKIAAALTPQLREKVAVDLRYKDDKKGRTVLDDTSDVETGLRMIVGDLRRHVGDGGDEIADVAAGGEPRPGGAFAVA